jgi:hypothetical protein
VEICAAESWTPPATEKINHALILRSWNHLKDPVAVVRSLRAALAPGGTLTVVDNVVFGLARTRRQTHRARRSPAGFEHLRNDDAARAHQRIGPEGFELLQRQDVRPDSSNQWLLRYRLATLGSDE